MARPRILALDLESTLVSNAVSRFARPHLNEFLDWARDRFERVVLFTSVREEVARDVMRTLVDHAEAPTWAPSIEVIAWSGTKKDLSFVPGTTPDETLLVDDQERYVVDAQKSQWIRIAEWDAPYADTDRELDRVREVIEARLKVS